jgi:hypothetical protein
MKQDEIIEMARQSGFMPAHDNRIQHFAKLVAAKEREACANVAKRISDKYAYGYYGNEVDTADEIEAAIRARGEA